MIHDKVFSQVFNGSPSTIRVGIEIMNPKEGKRVSFAGSVVKMTGVCARYVRLGNGVTLQTEDKFSGLNSRNSYVHVKNGKRFVTYRVTSIGACVTLTRIKGEEVKAPLSKRNVKAANSVAKAQAWLKDAATALSRA